MGRPGGSCTAYGTPECIPFLHSLHSPTVTVASGLMFAITGGWSDPVLIEVGALGATGGGVARNSC